MPRDVTYQPRNPGDRVRIRSSKRAWLFIGLLAVNAAVFIYHGDPRDRLPAPDAGKPRKAAVVPERGSELALDGTWVYDPTAGLRSPGPVHEVKTVGLRSGQTVAQALLGAGVAMGDINAAIESARGLVDFRRLRPGDTFRARLGAEGGLLALDIRRGPADQVRAELRDGVWHAAKLDIPIDTVTALVHGEVESSLWDAMEATGEDPRLAIEVAEIFAWDVDFYSDVHPGDTFTVLIDKRYANGKLVDYGPIYAARFMSSGESHEAFRHESGATSAYYDANGKSLRKQLLKSPLKYGHVTSGFGRRVHPVLGYSRAHNGIDYRAPIGTPVLAVGDGRVVRAGRLGGYGNYVQLRHANGWVSEYAHLSRILVRTGQRISQKDVIALSGNTGLSTGPHVHYGLTYHGKIVNPASQKFDRGEPLEGAAKEGFLAEVERLRGALEPAQIAQAMPLREEE